MGAWKAAQSTRADTTTVTRWFASGHPGVGVVCGEISGHLEMLEIEGRAVTDGTAKAFFDAFTDHALTDLRDRILSGYTEASPSGGVHLYYRVADAPALGNTKLAQRPTPDGPTPLIETRGEGGFVVVAPSHGPVHPTGQPWRRVAGSPVTIATITAEERDAVHSLARTFDETPPPEPLPDPVTLDKRDGVPPGVDYNERAAWDDVLTPAGWTAVQRHGGRVLWRRPGKRLGVSAVTGGPAGDYLYVWSTSTELPAETGLSKWRTYALLNHGGDFSAAAKSLGAAGYGAKSTPRQPHRPVLTVLPGYGGGTNGSTPNGALAASLSAEAAPVPATTPATTHARTDDAVALALVDTHGSTLRYCPERGRWLDWDGHRWRWCEQGGGVVRERVKAVARGLAEDDAADVRHKVRALSGPGTSAIVQQASSDPRVVVGLAELDNRPWELNTPSGIVDLLTGALMPPDPSRLHTRSTTVAPDPAARPDAWRAFLGRTFAGHTDITGYMQRLLGYSATGAVRDQLLPFALGSGANGKSVLLGVVAAVLGDYARSAPAGFLMSQQYAKHETEIADLAGARFVVCSELNEQDRFDESRVKTLTGKDSISARFMRQDYFTFRPSHHLWLMGNHQPTITSGGPAFWRRLRIIPFTNVVPPGEQVHDLTETLSGEHGPAVLAWVVAGAVDYLNGGLREPLSVHAATEVYEREQDTVAQFIAECCRIGGGDNVRITIAAFRSAYEKWCRAEGVHPVSAKALGSALTRVDGVGTTRTNSARMYTGVSLGDLSPLTGPDTASDTAWWDR